MTKSLDDGYARRMAIQLAAQMPEGVAQRRLILYHLHALMPFMDGVLEQPAKGADVLEFRPARISPNE